VRTLLLSRRSRRFDPTALSSEGALAKPNEEAIRVGMVALARCAMRWDAEDEGPVSSVLFAVLHGERRPWLPRKATHERDPSPRHGPVIAEVSYAEYRARPSR